MDDGAPESDELIAAFGGADPPAPEPVFARTTPDIKGFVLIPVPPTEPAEPVISGVHPPDD
jgi:hypothetical protein